MLSGTPVRRLPNWVPSSWACRLFLLLTVAEAAIDIGIESVLLARFQAQEDASSDITRNRALPVFVGIFALAHIYQLALAIDAIVNKNTIMVIGLAIFNLCFLCYAIIQIGEVRAILGDGVLEGSSQRVPVQVLTGAIPFVIGIAEAGFIVLAWYLWREFGWRIYKQIGADRRMKKWFMHYQVYVCLLKFDFFIWVAFSLQLVLVVLQSNTAERWITIFAAPASLLLLILTWYSVRKEIKWGMLVFMIGCAGGLGYFVYKLFRIWQEKDGAYSELYKSLTIFSVLAILLLIVTFFFSIRCLLNFDKGLKLAMSRNVSDRKAGRLSSEADIYGLGPGGVDGKGHLPLGSGSASVLHLQQRLSID